MQREAKNIITSIFELHYDVEGGADREISQKELFEALDGVINTGAMTQIFMGKIDIILSVINKMPEPERRLYVKLFQVLLGPNLICVACHYARIVMPRVYGLMVGLRLMSGVSQRLIFCREVAEDFSPKRLKEYMSAREDLIDEFRALYKEN